MRDGAEAKLCRRPDGTETFLLCCSADRRQKSSRQPARQWNRDREEENRDVGDRVVQTLKK